MWIKVTDELPKANTPVLILCNGQVRIGQLVWEHPTHEETFTSYTYWDDPYDDGQLWEFFYITHWQPLPKSVPKREIDAVVDELFKPKELPKLPGMH